jgi:hypothetical protein
LVRGTLRRLRITPIRRQLSNVVYRDETRGVEQELF